MKKHRTNVLWMLLLVISSIAHAQKNRAELTLKDGTVIQGFAKQIGLTRVKFRKGKGEKPIWFDFRENLEKVKILKKDGWRTYLYLEIKNQIKGKILTELIDGEVSLYAKENKNLYGTPVPSPGGVIMAPASGSFRNYYLRRKEENMVFDLEADEHFTKDFTMAAANFFEDCAVLTKKIREGEFTKVDLKEMVIFYNEECN